MYTLAWQAPPRSSSENVMIVSIVLQKVMKNMMSLAAPDVRLHGLFIAIVWFTMAFR